MITQKDIETFERKLAMFQYTEFSGGTRNFLQRDVPAFIDAVRRMLTPTRGQLTPEEWSRAAKTDTAVKLQVDYPSRGVHDDHG